MRTEDIIQAKKEQRALCRKMRKEISESKRQVYDKILFDKVTSLDEFCRASVVLAYYPVNSEINTLPIIECALREGKRVALPISSTEDHTLTFRFINSLDELVVGAYSIPEPPSDATLFANEKNSLCIVPGLSFDREGNRLGYGKGFYDRFLADFNGVTLGLCYSEFLLEKIPTDENDRKVNIVVSDTEEVYIHE